MLRPRAVAINIQISNALGIVTYVQRIYSDVADEFV